MGTRPPHTFTRMLVQGKLQRFSRVSVTVLEFHPLGASHTSTHKWRGREQHTPSHMKGEKVTNTHIEREIGTRVHTDGEGEQ